MSPVYYVAYYSPAHLHPQFSFSQAKQTLKNSQKFIGERVLKNGAEMRFMTSCGAGGSLWSQTIWWRKGRDFFLENWCCATSDHTTHVPAVSKSLLDKSFRNTWVTQTVYPMDAVNFRGGGAVEIGWTDDCDTSEVAKRDYKLFGPAEHIATR